MVLLQAFIFVTGQSRKLVVVVIAADFVSLHLSSWLNFPVLSFFLTQNYSDSSRWAFWRPQNSKRDSRWAFFACSWRLCAKLIAMRGHSLRCISRRQWGLSRCQDLGWSSTIWKLYESLIRSQRIGDFLSLVTLFSKSFNLDYMQSDRNVLDQVYIDRVLVFYHIWLAY